MGRGCSDAQVDGNYLVGSSALVLTNCTPDMHDNTVVTQFGLETLPEGRNNSYRKDRPSGTVTRVRLNQYEPGHSFVTVYNWNAQPSVTLAVSDLGLADGDPYEVRDVQHDGARPVLSGVVDGGTLVLPLTARPTRMPVGATTAAPSTLPEFTVFAIRRRSSPAPAAEPST
jgi:hypothetical protein